MPTAPYTPDFGEVLAAERERIATQRANRGIQGARVVGLALSGGGIRSASFGLGVLQALAAGGVFRRIDYLSTVSGGGYIGSSLTWFLRDGSREFPFGNGEDGRPPEQTDPSGGVLSYLRQHGDYLDPRTGFNGRSFDPDVGANPRAWHRGGVSLLSLAGVVVKNMMASTVVYVGLLVVLFFALNVLDSALLPFKAVVGAVRRRQMDLYLDVWNVALIAGFLLVALIAAMSLVHSLMSFFAYASRSAPDRPPRSLGWGYRSRLRVERTLGKLWFLVFASFVVGSVPLLSLLLEHWFEHVWARGALGGVAISVGAWFGSRVFRSRTAAAPNKRGSALINAVAIPLGGLLLVYGQMLLAHTVALAIIDGSHVGAIYAVLAGSLVFGLLADVNALGMHKVYRDRLMEAFMPGHQAVAENEWRPAVEADRAMLDEMCGAHTAGPYHLINTTVIAVDSAKARLRGRCGDAFVLSPLFCGSGATGWRQTQGWLPGGITLATAMAISGAAANPEAGADGRGPTLSRGVSIFMALLNLRLGYWAFNPNPRYRVRWRRLPPNFLYPGLAQGLLGANLSETKPFVELSDGGHFENLGIYELIRREVDLIIVADAGDDPDSSFTDLATAIERVRADFNVTITFSDPERDLSGLLPLSAGNDLATAKFELAQRGHAVAKIAYGAKEGVLVYLKSVMTQGMSADILGYKAAHASFPDQSTANQEFDEEQFEAYRELGYQVTTSMIEAEPIVSRPDPPAEART
jgi:hypothetical protein